MDSTLILGLFIFLLGFTYLGLMSEVKIFSLFALGPAWLLIVEFQSNLLFVTILAGFMLFSVYYALSGSSVG